MIRFNGVDAGPFRGVSFQIPAGAAWKVVTGSEGGRRLFLELLAGMKAPERGEVSLFGVQPARLTEGENIDLLRRAGIVWSTGGVISNLKAWENIVLPMCYHEGVDPADAEEEVTGILLRLGLAKEDLAGFLPSLGGALPQKGKRTVGVARCFLSDPELIVYEGTFTDLDPRESRFLGDAARWFHLRREGRTSLYLSAAEEPLRHLQADGLLRLGGGEAGE